MKLVAVVAILAAACTPDLADETSLVQEPRILAVRAEPAEAAPGTAVGFEALFVGPDGVVTAAPLAWAFCAARKPFTEPGPISPACLDATSDELSAFGTGVTVTGTLPADGCRVFGPDRPDPKPGEPAGRPTDPDGTGGYYAPVLITGAASAATLAQTRIRCALPAATPAQASEYLATYQPNVNPVIDSVAIERGGTDTPLTALESDPAAIATVAAGEDVHLVVHWADAAAEPYVWFDPARHVLTTRREAMRVSWFVSAGSVESGHTGRAETDPATLADDHWLAPDAGTALVWVVLRDDRGGTTWASYRFAVGASARVLTPRM